ncbi:hypothetical protein ACTAZI_00515 [Legionella bozemanae]|uniref:hypothetical protein n=1 Tax=Legionella bozemanae TaxID=447 RepID=UPI00399D1091
MDFLLLKKSNLAHQGAVAALKDALKENSAALLANLYTLRKDELGGAIGKTRFDGYIECQNSSYGKRFYKRITRTSES